MRKKKILLIIGFILCFYIVFMNCNFLLSYSYELDFNYILDTIGIPKNNKVGERINEEIYRKYNIFVYSDPISILSKTNLQRFKEVSGKGKYQYNGKSGEFYILGTNFEGNYVYNVYFPVDFMPDSYPTTWSYVSLKEFENSWYQTSAYASQLEYIKNNKLLFDNIDLNNNICDSYNLVEYDIIPSKYGLSKFRLNSFSTWKTMGIVTAKRRLKNGLIRDVIFMTKPMALDAEVSSYINIQDEVYISEEADETIINFSFGAEVLGLTEYATQEQIKSIYSEIYVNGNFVDTVSGSKVTNIDKNIEFKISREKDDLSEKVLTYTFEVKSYLLTGFKEDGILCDKIKKDVVVKMAPRKLVPVNDINLKVLSLEDGYLVASPLMKLKEEIEDESYQGVMEKGRRLIVYLEYGQDFNRVKKIEVFANEKECEYEILKKDEKYMCLEPYIEDKVYINVGGWRKMRKEKNNYLDVKREDIGKKIDENNQIKIKLYYDIEETEDFYILTLGIADEYIDNVNRVLDVLKENKENTIKILDVVKR